MLIKIINFLSKQTVILHYYIVYFNITVQSNGRAINIYKNFGAIIMIFTRDAEVNELAKAFETRALPKSDWTHAAHLVVALYYCYHHPAGVAKNLMRDGIYWLNDAHGTPNTDTSGYHETITIFWLETVAGFLDKAGRDKGLAELANGLLDVCDDPRLPLKHYSRERLFSVEARMHFVEPDLEHSKVGMMSDE
jgi:hypothetical protein